MPDWGDVLGVCHEDQQSYQNMKHVPDELRNMDKLLADKYFSLFDNRTAGR